VHVLLQGKHGEVFRGSWRGTPVAIKRFKLIGKSDELIAQALEGMLKEASLLAALRHPNIVLLLGISIEMPSICLITELLSNGSLYDMLHPSTGGLRLVGLSTTSQQQWQQTNTTTMSDNTDSWESDDRDTQSTSTPAVESSKLPLPSVSSSVVEYNWRVMRHLLIGAARGIAFLHGCNPPVCAHTHTHTHTHTRERERERERYILLHAPQSIAMRLIDCVASVA
jgi:hypothetical protein